MEWYGGISGDSGALVSEAQVFQCAYGGHVDCDLVHGGAIVERNAVFDFELAGGTEGARVRCSEDVTLFSEWYHR